MVNSCVVFNCTNRVNNTRGKSFFRFPKAKMSASPTIKNQINKQRNSWFTAVKRANLEKHQLDQLRICSDHFIDGKPAHFSKENDPSWKPTLKMGYAVKPESVQMNDKKRHERMINRKQLLELNKILRTVNDEDMEECDNSPKHYEMEDVSLIDSSKKNLENIAIQSLMNIQFDEVALLKDQLKRVIEMNTHLTNEMKKKEEEILDLKCIITRLQGELKISDEVNNNLKSDLALLSTREASTKVDLIIKESDQKLLIQNYENLKKNNTNLFKEMLECKEEILMLRKEVNILTLTESFFENDNSKIKYFTGLSSMKLFKIILKRVEVDLNKFKVKKLSNFQKLLITFMKLRFNSQYLSLAYRFNIKIQDVSKCFQHCIVLINYVFGQCVYWPDRDSLKLAVPYSFQVIFGHKVAVIIDCFEIHTQRPSNIKARASSYSNYKHNYTTKYLIGITPQGVISFISVGWGGRTSDSEITEKSRLLNNLEAGDVILSDRGFLMKDKVAILYAELVQPDFIQNKSQLPPEAIENTRKIASVRIHVERVISVLKNRYKILKGPVPLNFEKFKYEGTTLIDYVVKVCCILANLEKSVVPMNNFTTNNR